MGNQCCSIRPPQYKNAKQAKAQLTQVPLHEKQIQMLHLIYSDLAERVTQRAITLQNFVLFFHKNGFWGERLFKQFDYTETHLIVEKQFMLGMVFIAKIFKNNEQKKIQLLYKFFSSNNKKRNSEQKTTQKSQQQSHDQTQGVSFQNFLIMLYNYPKDDLKKILNDKQFFDKELRGSLKIIGQNRRLQSVYKMGSYIEKKKPLECRIQQKSQVSQIGGQKQAVQSMQSIGSMIGRNILKNLKITKGQQTTVQIQSGENVVQIKTSNFHHLVKKFARRMFKDMKIDLQKQKMSEVQFYNWIQKHKKLYETFFRGFHNQVWQIDDSTQQPMYLNRVFQKKSQCKYISPHLKPHIQKYIKVQAMFLNSIIIITNQHELSEPLQTICLEGLAVNKIHDNAFGYGINITHRQGIYQKRQLFFNDQKTMDQWIQVLMYFKGQSVQQLYTFNKQIGAGKFSVVYQGIFLSQFRYFCLYQGVEKATNKKYAIKVIESYKLQKDQKELISHQTNIMKIFSHPLLVQFKESIQTKTHLYIITQLCSGKDLFQFIKDHKPLNQYNASIVMQQMIVGLRYMHSLGIVHRDIKPENIMVSAKQNNQIDKIKIIDFGFSNYLDALIQLPPEENLAGTPNYIAPQVLRREPIGYKIDIFALGVILYYILSGKLPFNDYTLTEIFNKTLDGIYDYPQKIWSKLSPQSKDLIDKFLKSQPEQRISLQDAIKHPWFKVALAQKQKSQPQNQDKTKQVLVF